MANTSKFDKEDVLYKASQLFWGKGFAGTSIRDIQDVVNMRPGSIYATFGSKEGLYKEALLNYTHAMGNKLDAFISQAKHPIDGLQRFVENIIIEEAQDNPSGICMLYKANGEFNGQNPLLFELSQSLIDQFENKISHVFTQAKQLKLLESNFDEKSAAQQFIILFTGLRHYFNGRNAPQLAKTLIDKMFHSLIQPPHPTTAA